MCVFVSLKGQCRCDNVKRMSVCLKACFCLHMQPGGEMVASVFCPFLLITCNKHLYNVRWLRVILERIIAQHSVRTFERFNFPVCEYYIHGRVKSKVYRFSMTTSLVYTTLRQSVAVCVCFYARNREVKCKRRRANMQKVSRELIFHG